MEFKKRKPIKALQPNELKQKLLESTAGVIGPLCESKIPIKLYGDIRLLTWNKYEDSTGKEQISLPLQTIGTQNEET